MCRRNFVTHVMFQDFSVAERKSICPMRPSPKSFDISYSSVAMLAIFRGASGHGAAYCAPFGRLPLWFTQHCVPLSRTTMPPAVVPRHDDFPLVEGAEDESDTRDWGRFAACTALRAGGPAACNISVASGDRGDQCCYARVRVPAVRAVMAISGLPVSAHKGLVRSGRLGAGLSSPCCTVPCNNPFPRFPPDGHGCRRS